MARLFALEALLLLSVVLCAVLALKPMGLRGLVIWLVLIGTLIGLGAWTLADLFGVLFFFAGVVFFWHLMCTLWWWLRNRYFRKYDAAQQIESDQT